MKAYVYSAIVAICAFCAPTQAAIVSDMGMGKQFNLVAFSAVTFSSQPATDILTYFRIGASITEWRGPGGINGSVGWQDVFLSANWVVFASAGTGCVSGTYSLATAHRRHENGIATPDEFDALEDEIVVNCSI